MTDVQLPFDLPEPALLDLLTGAEALYEDEQEDLRFVLAGDLANPPPRRLDELQLPAQPSA